MNAIEFIEQTGLAGGEGYTNLPYAKMEIGGKTAFVTVWKPSADELARLNAGEAVVVWQWYNPAALGYAVPMNVEVADPQPNNPYPR